MGQYISGFDSCHRCIQVNKILNTRALHEKLFLVASWNLKLFFGHQQHFLGASWLLNSLIWSPTTYFGEPSGY